MRKIAMSGLVALAAVLGGAIPNCVAIGTIGAIGATNPNNFSPLSGIWNGKAWRLLPA